MRVNDEKKNKKTGKEAKSKGGEKRKEGNQKGGDPETHGCVLQWETRF